MTWADGVEAYVTPVAEDCVGVAWLWDPKRFLPEPAGARLAEGLMRPFEHLEVRLRGCRSASSLLACGPMAGAASAAHSNRALLLGDALGFHDGITGEGLSVALCGALHIGALLPELWRSGRLNASDLQPLADRLTGDFAHAGRMAKLALGLADNPAYRRRAVRMLARSPLSFTHLLEFGMARRSLRQFPFGELGRLGLGLFK